VFVVDEGKLEGSRGVVSWSDEEGGGGLTRIESSDFAILAGESEKSSGRRPDGSVDLKNIDR